jgi:hypothetical protein
MQSYFFLSIKDISVILLYKFKKLIKKSLIEDHFLSDFKGKKIFYYAL